MRTNVLRSAIIAQATRGGRSVSNLSSSANGSGSPVRDKMIQCLGLAMGTGTSYYLYGDLVADLEAKRQKLMSEYKGHSRGITDLREKMWPRLKKKSEPARRMWSGVKEKIWTGRGEEMWSDLSGNMDSMWSDLRGNVDSMWSDLREKMSPDRKP